MISPLIIQSEGQSLNPVVTIGSQLVDAILAHEEVSKEEAINLMIKNPILIKRPLLDINGTKICGFDIEKINNLLNTNIDTNKKLNTCSSSDSCTNV